MKCKNCPQFVNAEQYTEPGFCKVDSNPRWPGEKCDVTKSAGGHVKDENRFSRFKTGYKQTRLGREADM